MANKSLEYYVKNNKTIFVQTDSSVFQSYFPVQIIKDNRVKNMNVCSTQCGVRGNNVFIEFYPHVGDTLLYEVLTNEVIETLNSMPYKKITESGKIIGY